MQVFKEFIYNLNFFDCCCNVSLFSSNYVNLGHFPFVLIVVSKVSQSCLTSQICDSCFGNSLHFFFFNVSSVSALTFIISCSLLPYWGFPNYWVVSLSHIFMSLFNVGIQNYKFLLKDWFYCIQEILLYCFHIHWIAGDY